MKTFKQHFVEPSDYRQHQNQEMEQWYINCILLHFSKNTFDFRFTTWRKKISKFLRVEEKGFKVGFFQTGVIFCFFVNQDSDQLNEVSGFSTK